MQDSHLVNTDTDISSDIDSYINDIDPENEERRGAPKGRPKPEGSGRQKGAVSSRNIWQIKSLPDLRRACLEKLGRDFDDLNVNEVAKLYMSIEKFFTPQLSAVHTTTVITHEIDFSKMDHQQLLEMAKMFTRELPPPDPTSLYATDPSFAEDRKLLENTQESTDAQE